MALGTKITFYDNHAYPTDWTAARLPCEYRLEWQSTIGMLPHKSTSSIDPILEQLMEIVKKPATVNE